MILAARKRSLRQGNAVTPVCQSFCSQVGVSVPACATGHMTMSLSTGDLCLGGLCQGEPPYRNKWAVRILLECILVV